jgi:hypothetical protein
MYPRVMGLKGRFTLDVNDPPGTPNVDDQPAKSKKASKEDGEFLMSF